MTNLPDVSRGKIRDEFRDENLASVFGGDILAALRVVPAAQRQNVLVEQYRRMYETRTIVRHSSRPGGMAMPEGYDVLKTERSHREVLDGILAENGWGPAPA